MRVNQNQSGLTYDGHVMRGALICLALLLMMNLAIADQDFQGAPKPAPTDAVKVSSETFTAVGRAPVQQGQGLESARHAALLQAYRNLVVDGLRDGVLVGGWGELEGDLRLFQVDQDHPNPQMMAWLTRSKVVKEANQDGFVSVTIESPPTRDLSSVRPSMRAMVTQDVDRDGLSDVVGVGYDGSVYVTKATTNGDSEILAKSPSYAYFEIVSGPGLERVRAVLPVAVGSIESAGPGQARVVLELETLEMVNGTLLGRNTEQREILVALSDTEQNIRFSLEEPTDFARLYSPEVELRGKALANRTLKTLEIRQNGEVAWESPEGMQSRALQFNLARHLNGGWNLFRLTATDDEGFLQRRDLWLQGPPSAASIGFSNKRAIVVTLDDGWREKKVLGSLQKAGYNPDGVTFLETGKLTSDALTAEIRQGRGASDLLLYLEAHSDPGQLIGGKDLKLGQGSLTSTDLAQAIEAGGYVRSLMIFSTELIPDREQTPAPEALWADTTRFLERLGDGGRLAVANVEIKGESVRGHRSRSRDQFLSALDTAGPSDLLRLFDAKTPRNTLFRGWMFGPPVLGTGQP